MSPDVAGVDGMQDANEDKPTTHERTINLDSESVTCQIALLLAELEETDATELPPLYNSVNTDALDALADSESFWAVEFSTTGYDIRVTSLGDVELTEWVETDD